MYVKVGAGYYLLALRSRDKGLWHLCVPSSDTTMRGRETAIASHDRIGAVMG